MRLLSRSLIILVICVAAMALPAAPAQAQSPEIHLSPTSGVPGRDITVYGSNFTPNKYVDIYYDADGDGDFATEEWMIDVETDDDGAFGVEFEVPPSYKGAHTVHAEESGTSGYVAEADFTVKPGLSVDPEEGPVGTNVTVEGQGFAKNEESVEIRYYPGSNYETVLENIEADENGSWEETFLVPSSARGAHRIDGLGETSSASTVRDTTFEVTPAISLAQSWGRPGQNITMTGSGFYAGDSYIKILFAGEEAQTQIIRTDENGHWQGHFEVPAMAVGTYSVTAEGQLTPEEDVAPLDFEIRSGLVLSPSGGHVGTELTVAGYGFAVDEDVNVMYDGNQMAVAETDGDGSFWTSFVVPESQHGQRTVKAQDAMGNNATAIFTMESDPPSTPEPISPDGGRAGFIGGVRPTFEWSEVSDDSGVHYNLQISISANVTAAGFANPTVSITDITGTNYTLEKQDALPYGAYYWIVRAVDGAGNAGDWSEAYSFHAGVLPLWAFVLIIVGGVAIIGTLVYFFIIRKRIYYY